MGRLLHWEIVLNCPVVLVSACRLVKCFKLESKDRSKERNTSKWINHDPYMAPFTLTYRVPCNVLCKHRLVGIFKHYFNHQMLLFLTPRRSGERIAFPPEPKRQRVSSWLEALIHLCKCFTAFSSRNRVSALAGGASKERGRGPFFLGSKHIMPGAAWGDDGH